MSKFWVQFDTDFWVSRTGFVVFIKRRYKEGMMSVLHLKAATDRFRPFESYEEARAAALAFMQKFEEQES